MKSVGHPSNTKLIGNIAEKRDQLLFYSLRHYSMLVLNFSDIKCSYKIKF